jgi:hypothetical protein
VTDAAAPGRVLIWDFDGTLGHRPAHWSGAVADALTDVLGPHEFSQAPKSTPDSRGIHLR